MTLVQWPVKVVDPDQIELTGNWKFLNSKRERFHHHAIMMIAFRTEQIIWAPFLSHLGD